jgi:hypothetical protein
MIAAAIGLILVGILLTFIAFPFGFIPGAIGLVLLVVYLVGAGRRAGERGT